MVEKLRIKEVIKKHGKSVQEVADIMGISRYTLSTHINGNPSAEILIRISNAIGCDVVELFKSDVIPPYHCPHCGKEIDLDIKKKES